MRKIPRFTLGSGDRFAHQGIAQLQAVVDANADGIAVHPVWNKSNREHSIIGSDPADLRAEADAAVAHRGWTRPYFVDADHINLQTVDRFIDASDFYTIDVADFASKPAEPEAIEAFVASMKKYEGELTVPGMAQPLIASRDRARAAASKFLFAMSEAGRIFRHICERKGADQFVAEVSVDETDTAQTPLELFYILAMLAQEGVPVQTIAPKFTGRFNKGVDYVGDLARFEKEFDEDLYILAFAVAEFGLPDTLKLSVHSGSDKFSLYPAMNRLIRKHNCGLHVKTAGTTWLEEVIGLAEAGGEALTVAREIFAGASNRFDELTGPYAAVIDIDRSQLPTPEAVAGWDSAAFVAALRHDPRCPAYNPHFRQLIHVGFKIAAGMGSRYLQALETNAEVVGRNVHQNLLERHIRPIFRGTQP